MLPASPVSEKTQGCGVFVWRECVFGLVGMVVKVNQVIKSMFHPQLVSIKLSKNKLLDIQSKV